MDMDIQFNEAFNKFFNDKISEIKVVDRCYEDYDDKRYYAFITGSKGDKVVIKCYRNNYNTEAKAEGYGYLSNACMGSGINVPIFYKTNENKFCTSLVIKNETYLIWCEKFLPYETLLNKREEMSITPKFFYLMGEFVGKIHSVTRNQQICFPWNSAMVLFDGFSEENEYDENYENAKNFYGALIEYQVDKNLLEEIWDLYNKKRNQIRKGYDKLPSGGVQGDLSPNNILVDGNNPVAIIDFNQSGNDVYVNDMMQWAVDLVYGYFIEGIKPTWLKT
jgi:Ser/Thr protein kinase RdoA (MazF antagonist)